MTKPTKFLLFFVALFAMACFAIASILMAISKGWLATLFFVLAFIIISFGFVTRRKALAKDAQLGSHGDSQSRRTS